MPSSARLGAVQRHLANAAAATTELTGRKNEDGSMAAYDGLTPAQRFEFDVRGYYVMKQYYTPEEVATFNAGIDELQALAVTHGNYTELGLSLDGGIPRDAALDPSHERWHGRTLAELAAEKKQNRADMLICGTDKFDRIVRDPQMKAIHTELAGGQCMLSNNYYIEKHGPCHGGGLHHGGFPKMRTFHYGYDHTTSKFDCYSTKATIILSDMSTIEKGPFACIPGSHKSNLDVRTHLDTSDASTCPLAEPVFAEAGDVVIVSAAPAYASIEQFTEGITHNAYPVLDDSRRRSLFFNWIPAVDRDNLPHMRMSIYPEHVLERLADEEDQLTAPGYI